MGLALKEIGSFLFDRQEICWNTSEESVMWRRIFMKNLLNAA